MSLPTHPHVTTTWTQVIAAIRPGEVHSWRVYALQRALITRGYSVVDDGDYDPGRGTEKAVRAFQAKNGLMVDGLAGGVTQRALVLKVEEVVDERHPRLPNGMAAGIVIKETSGFIGATNDFDPSASDKGTDCGCCQWRVRGDRASGIPYSMDALRAAFDPERAIERSIVDPEKGLLPRFDRVTRAQPRMSLELRWRSAIIGHNAPFLFQDMVQFGRLETPNALARWISLPNGGHPTHQQHFNDYSGDVLKYVDHL